MIKIKDYEIKEPLGEGGMATVYLAIHKRLQREVALKVMKPEASGTKAFQNSFIIEGRTVAKLEHPNIVKIYDIDSDNGHFYMSMEILRKGSLKQRLANGKLPASNALKITAQIASALNAAHNYVDKDSGQKGYIHRDIKPANIMFRDDGSAVLTDFGIAKMQGTTSEMTQMGYIAGTPYYMAPEQATGNHQIDHRADIYSLGIVFYEMLTGDKPFTGSNTVAITYEHVHAPIPKLTGEHSIFQPMLDKALAKKPEERFATIEQFSQELYQASGTDAATLLLKPTAPITATEKKPVWPWLVAMAVIGFGGITGTYYFSKSHEEKRIAEQQRELARKAEEQKAALDAERLQKEKEAAQREEELKALEVSNLLKQALFLDKEKSRVFNHTNWSPGCKDYLIARDGPYSASDSSEWHYQRILELDPENPTATTALQKIAERIALDFSACDNYKFPSEQTEEIDSLFQD
ncbi:MAG: protein kinase domain-containing protein [Thiolinea sp.]